MGKTVWKLEGGGFLERKGEEELEQSHFQQAALDLGVYLPVLYLWLEPQWLKSHELDIVIVNRQAGP